MSYRKGIIPAVEIKSKSNGHEFIEEYVNSILGLVEDSIVEANDRKELSAKTEIPTNFDVPYMENARAQMYIYYHTLRALKKAEYKARLELGPPTLKQKAFIHTQWITKDDIEEEKYMNDFITAHTIDTNNSTNNSQKKAPQVNQGHSRRRRPYK